MKNTILFIVAILLIPSISQGDESACSSYVLSEASTGMILESKDAETPRPPASMVKLMLAYSVLKQIKEGNLKPTDMVNASTAASKIGGSQVYLKEGREFLSSRPDAGRDGTIC
jgi:D-alanyl-D-alanine carboxypeptidase